MFLSQNVCELEKHVFSPLKLCFTYLLKWCFKMLDIYFPFMGFFHFSLIFSKEFQEKDETIVDLTNNKWSQIQSESEKETHLNSSYRWEELTPWTFNLFSYIYRIFVMICFVRWAREYIFQMKYWEDTNNSEEYDHELNSKVWDMIYRYIDI